MASLANLKELYLYDNQVSGEIPPELGNLANLRSLSLRDNQLTGEIPSELGSLTKMTLLRLEDNRLSGVVPQTLAGLTLLERFSFYNNPGLCAPIDDAFQTWLRGISIEYGSSCAQADSPEDRAVLVNVHSATDGVNWTNNANWLSDDLTRQWYGVTNDANGRVNGLFLGGNQLTGEIPLELGSLANLRSLSLRDNQLTGEIPPELGSLATLERLRLFNNQLTGEIPAELGSLTNLEHLRLDGNRLTGDIPAELGRLTNLTLLYLSGNRLTGCVPASLRDVADNDFDLPFCVTATRSFSPAPVAPGGTVTVTIAATNYGGFGAVTETLPVGFTYLSSSLPGDQVNATGQEVGFTLQGNTSFTYTATAPGETGTYTFSGRLRDSDRNDHVVGGDTTVTVSSGDPLIARYDANNNGTIEKSEVIQAINDYLFGEGDPISKAEVIELINLYLFG